MTNFLLTLGIVLSFCYLLAMYFKWTDTKDNNKRRNPFDDDFGGWGSV